VASDEAEEFFAGDVCLAGHFVHGAGVVAGAQVVVDPLFGGLDELEFGVDEGAGLEKSKGFTYHHGT